MLKLKNKFNKEYLMTAPLNLNEISIQEKFVILEELWESMSHDATASGFTPAWHLDILAQREQNIVNSQSSFSNLEDAKKRLQKLV